MLRILLCIEVAIEVDGTSIDSKTSPYLPTRLLCISVTAFWFLTRRTSCLRSASIHHRVVF